MNVQGKSSGQYTEAAKAFFGSYHPLFNSFIKAGTISF